MYNQCLICNKNSVDITLSGMEARKCGECGLVWLRDFKIFVEDYEKSKINLDEGKIESKIRNCDNRIKIFKKFVDLNNLCDVGCGKGIFLNVLKKKGYKNIVGIEPSIREADFARKSGLEVFNGSLEFFPELTKNNKVHIVTLFHVIEHLKNPYESLKVIYESLKEGDSLIIETPNIRVYSLNDPDFKHKLIYPEHLFYFKEENLKKLLEKIGFKIISTGERDFDSNSLSIKELLSKLGFSKRKENFDYGQKSEQGESFSNAGLNSSKNSFFGKIKDVIRSILNKTVSLVGKRDFIWIIVKK